MITYDKPDDKPITIARRELEWIEVDGRPCEVCDKHMHDHEWATLDNQGFVIDCSNKSE